MPVKLVIFDCDGVLVDSEFISNTVMSEVLSALGSKTSYNDCLALFLGHSWSDCLKVIEDRLQKKMPDDFYDMYMNKVFERFDRELKPIDGIKEVLNNMSLYLGMEVPNWPPENIAELSKKLEEQI